MEGTGLKTIGRDNNRSIVGPAVRLYFGPDICYLTLYCHPLVHIVHSSTVTRPAYLS